MPTSVADVVIENLALYEPKGPIDATTKVQSDGHIKAYLTVVLGQMIKIHDVCVKVVTTRKDGAVLKVNLPGRFQQGRVGKGTFYPTVELTTEAGAAVNTAVLEAYHAEVKAAADRKARGEVDEPAEGAFRSSF